MQLPRMRALLLSLLLVAAVAPVADAGTHARDSWTQLRRPFHLPKLAPGAACPLSQVDRRIPWKRANIFGGSGIGRGPVYRREERESEARSRELLAFVGLTRQADTLAKFLAYGDQRRLEIARALATDPGLLLLDEPTAGMNPAETRAATDLVRRIRDQGLAVVVIERQNSKAWRSAKTLRSTDPRSESARNAPSRTRSKASSGKLRRPIGTFTSAGFGRKTPCS